MTDDLPLPRLPKRFAAMITPVEREIIDEVMQAYGDARAAAAVAKERDRAYRWCDFYAHAIDHGGNRYVRSNDALTAAHAVKSGLPFPSQDAIRKGK